MYMNEQPVAGARSEPCRDHHGRQRPLGRRAAGLPRLAGHKRGADRVREIVESCPDLGDQPPDALRLLDRELEAARRRGDRADAALPPLHQEGGRAAGRRGRARALHRRARAARRRPAGADGRARGADRRQRSAAPDRGDQLRRPRRDPARDPAGGRGGARRAAPRRGHHARRRSRRISTPPGCRTPT